MGVPEGLFHAADNHKTLGNTAYTVANFRQSVGLLPGKATLTSPSGTVTDTTPAYIWTEVKEATWYYMWVNGPSGNVFKKWYKSIDVCSGGTCTVTPSTVLSNGAHRLWIQTWNEYGDGPWSNGMDFAVVGDG